MASMNAASLKATWIGSPYKGKSRKWARRRNKKLTRNQEYDIKLRIGTKNYKMYYNVKIGNIDLVEV